MIDFIAERSTAEKEAEVRRELDKPDSFASRFIEDWGEQARNAFKINWYRLAGLEPGNEPPAEEKPRSQT